MIACLVKVRNCTTEEQSHHKYNEVVTLHPVSQGVSMKLTYRQQAEQYPIVVTQCCCSKKKITFLEKTSH